ncbi:reverse transcriptase [Elysia marginata]|uniref:Reverse transcriptase n=1 Tax=Elysia marginata TaxID=1093978 RepID=A0AAV4J2G9_9GAST|nr:reverse transcriptase [Elysia marginata]
MVVKDIGQRKRDMVIDEVMQREDFRRIQKAVQQDYPACPLCHGRQITDHVLSSCKVALSQGRYTWRHNRVLQKHASVISTAKGQFNPPLPSSTIFTTEGGAKTWCGRLNTASTQRKGPLDGCYDWEVSADLPEWDKHSDVIRRTILRRDMWSIHLQHNNSSW